ncbi:hypothetical protein ACFWJT_15945 [Streptomyces sp. NPDC127069]|uniref:hypothetical protein n=1 Tax=Streptomyces sp. NPDC127069 TaxID=3347128 RepID=UPI0036631D61
MANDIEINVRVANQTGTGLAAVTSSLARLKAAAREASNSVERLRVNMSRDLRLNVSLGNDTATAITAIKSALRDLRAQSPVRLEARFSGDTAQITTSAAAMRDLQRNSSGAGGAMGPLGARAAAATAALEALQHAADEVSDALRTLRTRASAAAVSLQELRLSSSGLSTSLRSVSRSTDSAGGRMETLATRTESLRTRMSALDGTLGSVSGSLTGLRGGMGSASSSTGRAADSSNRLLAAALALAPALIPLASAAVPLAVGMTAAGSATVAFGAALIPQLKAVGEATKAEAAYKKALVDHGAGSAQAAKAQNQYQATVQAMPQATREAAAALGIMTQSYKDWSESLAPTTLPVATKAFATLTALFPKLTPLVAGASGQLDRLMNILGGAVQSTGFDNFMSRFAAFATDTLARAITGAVRLAEAFKAGGSGREGIAGFMAFAREVGPEVGETLRNLGVMLGRLLVAASSTGVGLLSLVNVFAKLVNAIPPEVLSRLVQVATTFTLVRLAAAGLAAIGPMMTAAATGISAFIRAARFGGVASAIAGVTQQLTLLQKSTVVLAVLAAVAIGINELAENARGAPPDVDKLTTSLKNLAATGKFTGELKKTFGDVDGLVQKIQQIGVETKKAADATKGAFGFRIPVLDDIGNWLGTKFADMTKGEKSLTALKEDFQGLDKALAGLASSGHADVAAESFRRISEAAGAQGISLDKVKELLPEYGEAVAALNAEQQLTARGMGLFGEQAVAVQAKLDAQKASTDGLRQAIQALNDVNRSALGGMIGFEAAIDAAAKAAAENAGSLHMIDGVLDLNKEKARNAASALADLASKTDEAASSARESGASWETVNGIYARGREQLIASAVQMGLTTEQAQILAAQILSTPDKTAQLRGNMEDLQSKLDSARQQLKTVPNSRRAELLANISDLEAKVARAKNDLAGIRDRTVWITTYYMSQSIAHPGGQAQAHGGVIGAAGGGPRSRMTLVGEQGPELVDLAPGSRVRSNPDSRRIADGMAGGSGGGPIVIQLTLDGRQVAEAVFDPLRYEIRTRGGNVQAVLGQAGAA